MRGELPAATSRSACERDRGRGACEGARPSPRARPAQLALEAFAPALPEMLGGSADLTGSQPHQHRAARRAALRRRRSHGGRHINYGVREFGMAAIMNGIALHGGYIPYGGTFLTFSRLRRNAVRMAALMKQRVIYVFTHDSIGLGEDGPTHQAVEHAASLRLIPNLDVWRPCDTVETAVAWAARDRERATARARCCCRARTCRSSSRASAEQLAAIAPRRLRARRAATGGRKARRP